MRDHVRSHDVCVRRASTFASRFAELRVGSDDEIWRMNSSGLSAIATRPSSPYGSTTSVIGVETAGRPAARYSGVFVGLIKRVDSFRANGSSPRSQPDM